MRERARSEGGSEGEREVGRKEATGRHSGNGASEWDLRVGVGGGEQLAGRQDVTVAGELFQVSSCGWCAAGAGAVLGAPDTSG